MNNKQQEQYFILEFLMLSILVITFAMLVDCAANAQPSESIEETTTHEQYTRSAWDSSYCRKKVNVLTGTRTWKCRGSTPSMIRLIRDDRVVAKV
jgi:hypothetical protein